MAKKEKAGSEWKAGDACRVTVGDWGNGNRGTVKEVKGDFALVVLEGHKEPLEFRVASLAKPEEKATA